MDKEEYLNLLEKKHNVYYNVYRDYKLSGKFLDLYAEFHMRNERYFLMGVLDAYETHEYRFVKYYKNLKIEDAAEFGAWLQEQVEILVKPHSEHMCTILTGVMVTDRSIDRVVERFIKNYRYIRYFTFGVKGWGEIKLLGVDIASNRVVANRKGREVIRDFIISTPKPNYK
ncbi:hypothetical protein VTU32_09655 [Thermoanaerobacter sp. CM-CNRG TB177]|uniref:DUF8052 domain-containing protein n=1 Tax=Thermoanaerobacter pentosaceus TaxID=694059 RepID=A0ABT9M572_9THEO|nr:MULTISPECIES: hypothetical protein [Thermoanaerobacter]MBT1278602.1 hypothetical protein [Thermoanaerobacter sp. CM-CNRG TB177]MDP9751235.1 hypothetical protein [Thermoanaerobacter pentosaceus]